MILKKPIAYVIILYAIGFFIVPSQGFAEQRAYMEQSLDFGTVYPFQNPVTVRLDATVADPENEEIQAIDNSGHASGGHVGKLLFLGYDGVSIQLDFPDEIPLNGHLGGEVGYLRQMNRYSMRTPVDKDGELISYVGGTLSISSDIFGASGSLPVLITTF